MKAFVRLTDEFDEPVCVNMNKIVAVKASPFGGGTIRSIIQMDDGKTIIVRMELNSLCNLLNGD
jgi:hypothetical protein